jgi:AcrR family transcriptional regulator
MCLSLREKKLIKTKYALAIAFAQKLQTETFDSISIKDVCSQTDISEASFYNYFPQKIDVLSFLLKVKIFKIFYTIKPLQQHLPFKKCIEKTFSLLVDEIKHPFIFFEVLSLVGKHKCQMASFPLSLEELQCLYPECEDVSNIRLVPLKEFFEELIEYAMQKKEMAETTDKQALSQFLISLFIGVPLALSIDEFPQLIEIYRKHLSLVWQIFQL